VSPPPLLLPNPDLVELLQTSSTPLVSGVGDEAAAEMEGKRGGQTVSSRFTGAPCELLPGQHHSPGCHECALL
jgi:hypothetical protein